MPMLLYSSKILTSYNKSRVSFTNRLFEICLYYKKDRLYDFLDEGAKECVLRWYGHVKIDEARIVKKVRQ